MGGHTSLQQAPAGSELVVPQAEIATLGQTSHSDPDAHVSLVASGPASPEALLIGVALGALSAMLVVFACGYVPGDVFRGFVPGVLFIGVWISSAWLLTRETGRVLVVMRRGFILGALQWAVLTLKLSQGGATAVANEAASTAVAGAWSTMFLYETSSILIWICIAGFAGCWLFTRSPYRELVSNRP